jgi:hypothetical protein
VQGFTYHIDDLSADGPFLQTINGQPFATVPCSVHLNDIASFDLPGFSTANYEQQLVDELKQFYAEAPRAGLIVPPPTRSVLRGQRFDVSPAQRLLSGSKPPALTSGFAACLGRSCSDIECRTQVAIESTPGGELFQPVGVSRSRGAARLASLGSDLADLHSPTLRVRH